MVRFGLAGFHPNPFGRVAFIVGLANDVAITAGAVVEVAVCPVVIWPPATGAAASSPNTAAATAPMTTMALAAITASCNLTRCCGFDSTLIPSILASLIHSPANVPQDVTPVCSLQRWNEPVIALETALEKSGGSALDGLRRRREAEGTAPHGPCRACDETVYGPPLNTHCAALDGPAVVRISNAARE
jgi:hypothetical protein